jgi:hypothetical protein
MSHIHFLRAAPGAVRSEQGRCGMVWTREDSEDAQKAIQKMRDAIEFLADDVAKKSARFQTRRALDSAMAALLALDDVYFEDDAGQPVPEAWARARLLLRKA